MARERTLLIEDRIQRFWWKSRTGKNGTGRVKGKKRIVVSHVKSTTVARTRLFASRGRGWLIKEALGRLSVLQSLHVHSDATCCCPGTRTCAILQDDGGRDYCKWIVDRRSLIDSRRRCLEEFPLEPRCQSRASPGTLPLCAQFRVSTLDQRCNLEFLRKRFVTRYTGQGYIKCHQSISVPGTFRDRYFDLFRATIGDHILEIF